MSNTQNTENFDAIQIPDEVGKYWHDLSLALERLEQNADFKKVFLDGYLQKFAVDKVSLLNTEYSAERAKVMEKLISVANFESYMIMIRSLGASYANSQQQAKELKDMEGKNNGRF